MATGAGCSTASALSPRSTPCSATRPARGSPNARSNVPNGIPLSKIHHAAFDAHLIGIDPDYRLHVSERLLGQKDGPMLEALKRLNSGTISLPTRVKDRPDRNRLSLRFEQFKAVA